MGNGEWGMGNGSRGEGETIFLVHPSSKITMEEIRVCGRVQGVGFRPTVYRLAKACGLKGEVCNDGEGVLIRVVGNPENIDKFIQQLQEESPPLARIETITRSIAQGNPIFDDFIITHSINSKVKTEISPDAATCWQCKIEIFDPLSRYYRYPFTNCTHCGPRLSIIRSIPYDRNNTSMASFPTCTDCDREYQDVENRRFHAQPIACPVCGPKIWLEKGSGELEVGNGEEKQTITLSNSDPPKSPLIRGSLSNLDPPKSSLIRGNLSNLDSPKSSLIRGNLSNLDPPKSPLVRETLSNLDPPKSPLIRGNLSNLDSPKSPLIRGSLSNLDSPKSPLIRGSLSNLDSPKSSLIRGTLTEFSSVTLTEFSPLNKGGWGGSPDLPTEDILSMVCTLLKQGKIVAIKGLGGIHLACDATNETAVQKLRSRKQRYHKPFALMARDISVIEQYCNPNEKERELLESIAAPIVLIPQGMGNGEWRMEENVAERLLPIAPSVAPGQNTLGFMLPYTPLHHLILHNMECPIVLTSGNLSDEPQCIYNEEARLKLGKIADYLLLHNRDIINRIDDSVVRVFNTFNNKNNSPPSPVRAKDMDSEIQVIQQKLSPKCFAPTSNFPHFPLPSIQILRRARGYAPAPINLPPGFQDVPHILAMGGELKNTFCLLRDGKAILSQHLGDLENAAAFSAYQNTLNLYLSLFEHNPVAIAIDRHPEYLSAKLGEELAAAQGLKLYSIQHHHAHIAACLVENGIPMDAPPVLGIALDGLGYGDDGTFWGGEFMLADYRGFKRLGMFKPVAMIGGVQAIYQPWRNTYSQLMAGFTWAELQEEYGNLELLTFLNTKPRALLNQIMEKGINSPLTSSVGRLFDGVAAAIGICRAKSSYEGQAAIEMEGLVNLEKLNNSEEYEAYPLTIHKLDSQESYYMRLRQMGEEGRGERNEGNRGEERHWDRKINDTIAISPDSGSDTELLYIETHPLWQSILDDLKENSPKSVMATRFHQGLAKAIVNMVNQLSPHNLSNRVVLTGGVFQNRILLEEVSSRLAAQGITVLTHSLVPPNDGSLSLGQSAIAAATLISY